jgi:putative drug exporter of the RND superfamily
MIARTPGRTALAVVAVLVAIASFGLGTSMSYDLAGGRSTPATRTADEISAALSKGASDPLHVYVTSHDTLAAAQLQRLRERLAGVDGVSTVSQPVLTRDRRGALIDVALRHGPITKAAMDVVRGPVRDAAHDSAPAGAVALVGGTAAT